MSARWEYMLVDWEVRLERAVHDVAGGSNADPLVNLALSDPVWSREFVIWRPDGDRERRPDGPGALVALLDELGAAGWELASESTLRTAVTSDAAGDDMGVPALVRWTFKRPAAGR